MSWISTGAYNVRMHTSQPRTHEGGENRMADYETDTAELTERVAVDLAIENQGPAPGGVRVRDLAAVIHADAHNFHIRNF